MKQIRNNVFETNSSSTHSICIFKKPIDEKHLPDCIHFRIGEFGWECRRVEPADYMYTAIMCYMDDPETCLNTIETTLKKLGVSCDFGPVEKKRYGNQQYGEEWYVDNGCIDHCGEAVYAMEQILADEDKLIRFLLSDDSYVHTGNDNCDCKNDECSIAWDVNEDNNYQYYYKGN